MEWIGIIGGLIVYVIVAYIVSFAILELIKEDNKNVHVLAIILLILFYAISDCSKKKEDFNKENPELQDDF
jgi:hypothetical protein